MPRELLIMQNSFQWGTAEGQTLEIENAIRSRVRDLKIEGQTFQNLSNNIEYNGSGSWINVYNISENGTYTFKSDNKNAYITLYDKKAIDLLKENSIYTLVFDVDTDFVNYKGICINGNVDGYYDQSSNIYLRDTNTILTNGTYKFKFTMGSVTNMFAIGFRNTNTITGGTYFRAYNFKLLEGDYTNTELPTSIDGIESVAERESNNLLENVKWHDGWIDVMTGAFDSTHPSYCNAKYSDLISIDVNNNYYFSLTSNDNENVYRIRPYDADGNYVTPIDDTGNPILGNSFDIFYTYRRFFANVKYIRILLLDPTGYPPLDSLIFSQNIYTEGDSYYVKIAQSNNETDGIVLPNGVTNTIENGVYLQNVYKFIIDENAQMWTGAWDNQVNTIGFNIVLPYNRGVDGIISSYLTAYVNNSFTTDREEIHCTGTRCRLRILRSKLETEDIAGFKKFLKSNPITIYYALATPITQPLELTKINLPQPLRRLPNGVCDTIEGNKLIQRIGKMIVDGTNNITLVTIRDNTLRLFLTDSTVKNVNESDLPFLCDLLPKTTACWTYDVEGIYQGKQNHRFVISISKTKLSGSTLEAVKSYFTANPMTIYYELQTPIVHDLTIPNIHTEKGINIITTANNIKPNMSMKAKVKK